MSVSSTSSYFLFLCFLRFFGLLLATIDIYLGLIVKFLSFYLTVNLPKMLWFRPNPSVTLGNNSSLNFLSAAPENDNSAFKMFLLRIKYPRASFLMSLAKVCLCAAYWVAVPLFSSKNVSIRLDPGLISRARGEPLTNLCYSLVSLYSLAILTSLFLAILSRLATDPRSSKKCLNHFLFVLSSCLMSRA